MKSEFFNGINGIKFILIFFAFLLFVSLVSPIIANEKPLLAQYKSHWLFPVFARTASVKIMDPHTGKTELLNLQTADWKQMEFEFIVWPLIPYSPGKSDRNNRYLNAGYKSPFSDQQFLDAGGSVIPMPWRFRHWLGTDKNGSDLLAGLIHGTKVSLLVGFFSMLLSAFTGITAGSVSGYFGNHRITLSCSWAFTLLLCIFIVGFYGFFLNEKIAMVILLFVSGLTGTLLLKIKMFQQRLYLPVDFLILKIMELISSVPRLFWIIGILSVMEEITLAGLIAVIGFSSWTTIARITRSEMMCVRESNFIEAGQSLGLGDLRIILRHAIPNCIAPVIVAVSFSATSAIFIEGGFSFLGFTTREGYVSWGSLLACAKDNPDAWWFLLFPGATLFFTVFSLLTLAEKLRDHLDPRYMPAMTESS